MNAVKCQMNRYLRASSKQLNLAVWKLLRKYPKRNEMFPAVVDQNDPMHAEEMEGQLRSSKASLSPYVNSQLDQA